MAEHMYDTAEEICKAAGARSWTIGGAGSTTPGSAIHEHGTCRMGADPKRSALNAFNQMHEVKNVFVVDGSAFTTAIGEEPDPHHPRALLASHRLPGGGDQEGEPVGAPSLALQGLRRVDCQETICHRPSRFTHTSV